MAPSKEDSRSYSEAAAPAVAKNTDGCKVVLVGFRAGRAVTKGLFGELHYRWDEELHTLTIELPLTRKGRLVVCREGGKAFFTERQLQVRVGEHLYSSERVEVKYFRDAFVLKISDDLLLTDGPSERLEQPPTYCDDPGDDYRRCFISWNGETHFKQFILLDGEGSVPEMSGVA